MDITKIDRVVENKLQGSLRLDITPEKLEGISDALGPEGIGTFVVRSVLDSRQISHMQEEISDPTCVAWRDNHNDFDNRRGMHVEQRHDVFALKLSAGDHAPVERVPRMRMVAKNIRQTIRGLSPLFPNLSQWEEDEMSLHRYDEQEIGLGFHKDNMRFSGLIAVLTLEGASDVIFLDEDGKEHVVTVEEGDLNLTRGTGLYDASLSPKGEQVNLCPDHAVKNLRTPTRTSFIVRANSIPEYEVPGFTYDNWVGKPMPSK